MSMEGEPTQVRQLNRDEFKVALQKGQGRAFLHVLHYGLDDVTDLVLEACLHNPVYDKYFESDRGDWLFSMFKNSAQLPNFREAILSALKTEENPKDLLQLVRLGRNIADMGDIEIRQEIGKVVYRVAADPVIEDWVGVWDWIDLEGETGLLALARIYGQRLIAHPNDYVYWGLLNRDDYPRLKALLDEYSEQDAAIKAYRDYLLSQEMDQNPSEEANKQVDQRRRRRRLKQYTLPEILDSARSIEEQRNYRYMAFGRHATSEELEIIYTNLLTETEPLVLQRLLWVFRRAKLPRIDDKLLQWANGPEKALRSGAIIALTQLSDERINSLARDKAQTGSLLGADNVALDLFNNNYAPKDVDLIVQALTRLQPSADDAHSLGLSIIELAEKYEDRRLEKAVLWAYENTPCSFCRLKAVQWLDRFQMLPEALRFECKYDAEDDIRAYVHE
jgi:hypothetical protein